MFNLYKHLTYIYVCDSHHIISMRLLVVGLMRDDCLRQTPDFTMAMQRLSSEVADARQFRVSRAIALSMRKEILPKEEWTKLEEVVFLCYVPRKIQLALILDKRTTQE